RRLARIDLQRGDLDTRTSIFRAGVHKIRATKWKLRGVDPAEPTIHARISGGLDAHRFAEDIERRMDLEALHALVVGSINRPPQRLGDRPVLLHDLLELADD